VDGVHSVYGCVRPRSDVGREECFFSVWSYDPLQVALPILCTSDSSAGRELPLCTHTMSLAVSASRLTF
jgi:hypothetical protein